LSAGSVSSRFYSRHTSCLGSYHADC